MTNTDSKAYAICTECPEEFDSRDEMYDHGKATMAPTGEVVGAVARGHKTRVINPTPEEERRRLVRGTVDLAVEDAIFQAFEELDRAIQRGRVTEEEVTEELKNYPDFSDAWDEWLQESR